jgi:hypothetical protein
MPGVEGAGAPAKVIGRMETDSFCSGCNYNLHGLDVREDERLKIAVVCCPECGKYHPAGMATGAGRIWLGRLARMLVAAWVLFIVFAIVASTLGFMIMDVIELDMFVHRDWTGVTLMLRPADTSDFGSPTLYWMARALVAGIAILIGWIAGTFYVVFLWHVRSRAWFFFGLAAPLLVGLWMFAAYVGNPRYSSAPDRWWPCLAVMRQIGLQGAGMVLGILFGRQVTRVVLRVMLTRKLLQHVRFLWEVDGKKAPALREANPEEAPMPG